MEYWFDRRHTGALRVIDNEKKLIYGSDPQEEFWVVSFKVEKDNKITVDFHSKKTHHGKVILLATYESRRNVLHWEDGNQWLRIRHNPSILLNRL
jgi:hypothetical protein